jgi:ssDNA-specific exonuclease RecJ
VKKKIFFEINLSHFRGRDYVKGYVKDFSYDGRTGKGVSDSIFANTLNRFAAKNVDCELVEMSTDEIKTLIQNRQKECAYGLCMIASDRRTLKRYDELLDRDCDLFYTSSRNLANELIVSPSHDADLSGFSEFVFLDTPADFNISALRGKRVYVNRDLCGYKMFEGLNTCRENLLDIFSAIRKEVNSLNGRTAEEITAACDGLGFDRREFIFALNVFEELGLVSFADGRLTVYRGVKAELNDSSTYKKVRSLQGE